LQYSSEGFADGLIRNIFEVTEILKTIDFADENKNGIEFVEEP